MRLGSHYWNNVAISLDKHYRSKYISDYQKYENEELLNEWGDIFKNKKILVTDLFNEAFDGEELPINFWNLNTDIIGMDISEFIVGKFNKRYPSHKKIVCDVRNLPFKDSSLDFVISLSTLDHFSYGDLIISLQEIKRILKREGVLILFLHNKFNIFLYFYQIKIRKILPFPLELYSKNQIVEIFKKLNFFISECTAAGHIPFPRSLCWILLFLRKLNMWEFHNLLTKRMRHFTKLRKKKTKFLTGMFIVIKAIKK